MEENTVETNTLRKKNMQVFWIGTRIVVLVGLVTSCITIWFLRSEMIEELVLIVFDGGLQDGFGLLFIITILILLIKDIVLPLGVVLVFQLILFLIVKFLSVRNIEISGAKMWIFYAIELLIALTPFVIV